MRRSQEQVGAGGFSLLEVLAALGVFAIVTLGVVPLLGSALRASSTSRSATVGEEAARNAMERIQGTKWYVSYDAKPNKRVDILDLYFPQAASNAAMGQSYAATASNSPLVGTGGVFTTTCAPAPSSTNPACAFTVPTGYTATIKASFVKKHTPATTPDTYDIVTPGASYAWNSQGSDAAPSTLMDVTVTVGWTEQGKSRSYSLRAIVGDRKFSAPAAVDAGPSPSASAAGSTGVAKVSGRATIDYVAQANTSFTVSTAQPANGCPVQPCKSEANSTFGMAESVINTEDIGSTADQNNTVADFSVVRAYPTTQAPPPTPPPDLSSAVVANTVKHAPPYSLTATGPLTPPATYLTHPELANAQESMIYGGQNNNVLVDVSNELPVAQGSFQTYGTTNGIPEGFFTNSQIDFTNFHIASANGLGYFTRCIGCGYAVGRLGTDTSATTYSLTGSNRAVETKATAGFGLLSIARFVNGSKAWDSFDVQGFSASVTCKSTANPATATASASWSAVLAGYYDPNNNGSTPNSGTSWTATITSSGNDIFNGTSVPDAIASLKALNPLEFDSGTNANDIYLFEKRDVNGVVTQKGYISDVGLMKNPPTSESADGRTTSASIDGAIRIDTGQLNLALEYPATVTNISLGKVSCEAVDNR